jgi:hypothetical protein
LIAINKWVVSKENLIAQINFLSLGQTVQLSVLRDKKLKQLTFIAVEAQNDTIALEIIDQTLCNKWLG